MGIPVLMCWAALCCATGDAFRQSYVDALKGNGFADWAIEYLQLELRRGHSTDEERGDLEFEIAAALVESTELTTDLSRRGHLLDEAAETLAVFIRDRASHRRVGEARAELAQIDLQRAQMLALEAQLAVQFADAVALAERARKGFDTAAAHFQTAAELLEKQYRALPLYIPEKQSELRTAKSRLFEKFIDARFQAALARFYRADLHPSDDWTSTDAADSAASKPMDKSDPSSKAVRDEMDSARQQFEAIYDQHRRELVGLYSHLWMARCLAAQGEQRRAMGIFDQLMRHENRDLARFKRDVFHFRLISLAARREFDQVINQAEAWLRDNARFSREASYQGVQWQAARARLSRLKAAGEPDSKSADWIEALGTLERLAAYPNAYTALARREQLRLVDRAGRNLEARSLHQATSLANAKLMQAARQTDPSIRRQALAEVVQSLRAAIARVRSNQAADELIEARLALADAHQQAGESWEAATLAEWICRRNSKAALAPAAGRFAIEIWATIYDKEATTGRGDFEAARIRKLAHDISERWPGSKEAAQSLAMLGRLELARREYAAAIADLDRVPARFQSEPDVLSIAGRARWEAHKEAAAAHPNGLPGELRELRPDAIRRLEAASKLMRSQSQIVRREQFLNDASLAEALLDAGNAPAAAEATKPMVAALRGKSVPDAVEPALRNAALSLALQASARQLDFAACDDLLELSMQLGGVNATPSLLVLADRLRERLERERRQNNAAEVSAASTVLEKLLDRLATARSGLGPAERTRLAANYVAAGKPARAIEMCKTIVADPATDAMASGLATNARAVLVRAYLAAGDLVSARAEVDRLFLANRNAYDIVELRGTVIERQGDFRAALAHWKDVVTRKQRARPRPPEFYSAVDRVVSLAAQLKGADQLKAAMLGRSLVVYLLQTDASLSAERRRDYEAKRQQLEVLLTPTP